LVAGSVRYPPTANLSALVAAGVAAHKLARSRSRPSRLTDPLTDAEIRVLEKLPPTAQLRRHRRRPAPIPQHGQDSLTSHLHEAWRVVPLRRGPTSRLARLPLSGSPPG
jgi:hypothetical protein